MAKSVYVLRTGSTSDWKPVVQMFEEAEWVMWPGDMANLPDLVCFCGGSDVDPSMYGEENTSSYSDKTRDLAEKNIFNVSRANNIPMVGICRGGQFLNVMNGGKMIQHIDGHSGDREIFLHAKVPGVLKIREDHHQGIDSCGKGSVLAVDMYDDNEEIVWYEETSCLCFQPHPEWGHEGTKDLFFNLIAEYLGMEV